MVLAFICHRDKLRAVAGQAPSKEEDEDEKRLVDEYNMNIELWKHDDNLRQLRNNNFLSVNALFVVALGTYISLRPPEVNLAAAMILLAVLCTPITWVWSRMQFRNAEYIRFRRMQLLSIESRLRGLSTFKNTWAIFYGHQTVKFLETGDEFTVSKRGSRSSTQVENNLPLFILAFWLAVLAAGVILLAGAQLA